MPKYRIGCPIESASGTQYFTVDAESEDEAIAKFKKDGGEFDYEEVEVQDLGDPTHVELADEDDPMPTDTPNPTPPPTPATAGPSERIGPDVKLELSCFGCAHCKTERYTCQGDSGSDVYCAAMNMRTVGDTCWRTPEWCPVRAESIRAALASPPAAPDAGLLAKHPERRWTVDLSVGGDTLEDAVSLIKHFLFEMSRGTRSCCTGGYSQGGTLNVVERPDVTHDSFVAALDDYLGKDD